MSTNRRNPEQTVDQAERSQRNAEMRTKEFAQYLTENDISIGVADSAANLLAKEFKLGNITAADRRAVRYLAKNIVEYVDCEHPPTDSHLQGPYRAAMAGDMSERTVRALSPSDKIKLESAIMSFDFSTSRSEGGFQQTKMADVTKEQRQVRQTDEESGLLGGIFR